MTISSPAFSPNAAIPPQFSCQGANHNPPLELSDVPAASQSLVLIMEDPDAPGKTWQHWLVWNIDPTLLQLAENSTPAGATQGVTDFGRVGYGGPCPPSGQHRYQFRLFALDAKLLLDSNADRQQLDQAMHGHVIAEAMLIGTFSHS